MREISCINCDYKTFSQYLVSSDQEQRTYGKSTIPVESKVQMFLSKANEMECKKSENKSRLGTQKDVNKQHILFFKISLKRLKVGTHSAIQVFMHITILTSTGV